MVYRAADILLYILPLLLGLITSYYQNDTGKDVNRRIRIAGYFCVFAVVIGLLLSILSLFHIIPRLGYVFGVSNVPLGFVLGYYTFQINVKREMATRREGILLVGLILAGFTANILYLVITLVMA